MLQNRNILCIANPSWEADYSSTTVELMRVLGTQNRILYVDNSYTWKDILSSFFKKKQLPYGRILGFKSRVKKVQADLAGEVILLYPPVTIPVNFLKAGIIFNWLSSYNGWLVRSSIRRYLRLLRMEDQVINIISFNPSIGLYTGKRLGESLLIYHCYDEIGAATWMKKHGPAQERQFAKLADATIVTSQWLLETKRNIAKKVFLVKNAANVDLFYQAFKSDVSEVKIIGFIGSIDERLDYNLLQYVISSLSQYQFVFIGRIIDKVNALRLEQFPNVKFVPPQRLIELPEYVRTFSAGIIPFVRNEFTKGIYPLKINEYLAAGLPVVTTDFSYLDEFKNVVSITSDKESFKNALIMELAQDTVEKMKLRWEHARSNSWLNRAVELSGIVTSLEKAIKYENNEC
ncbi:glycosyltransferase [Flavitalea sp.]|nr:glycosyltransferase [Flavitalea sp.]